MEIQTQSPKRLMTLCSSKAHTFLAERNGNRAVRVLKDGALNTRTHNIDKVENEPRIWYENNNSKQWFVEFKSIEDRDEFWQNHIANNMIEPQN